MRFVEKLHVAVKRGNIKQVDGGLLVPKDVDVRNLLPNCKSASYNALRRSLQRAGYVFDQNTRLWMHSKKEC